MRKNVCAMLLLLIAFTAFTVLARDVEDFSSAVIDYNTLGDKTVISASANARIRIYRLMIFCNGANNITIKDGAGATLLPVMNLTTSQGLILDSTSPTVPWFVLPVNTSFVLNFSANQQCSGTVYYVRQ